MRTYRQLTSEERYALSTLRKQGWGVRRIARTLRRHASTISREVRRNASADGAYRAIHAQHRAQRRRSHSRRNQRLDAGHWLVVVTCLQAEWSPEQISGRLKKEGVFRISHETIYREIWADKAAGGQLYRYLRQANKKRRKRYGAYDSRGRLAGKRHISQRPAGAENRSRYGHLEGDTMMGSAKDKNCILTLVDRKSGYTQIGKLQARTAVEATRRAIELVDASPRPVRTVTVDNGTEFHGYKQIEAATRARFYFATPYHSWERGTNENTNGLIRQYLPKRKSMAKITQADCDRIADKLNNRPRKRLDYHTPREVYERLQS